MLHNPRSEIMSILNTQGKRTVDQKKKQKKKGKGQEKGDPHTTMEMALLNKCNVGSVSRVDLQEMRLSALCLGVGCVSNYELLEGGGNICNFVAFIHTTHYNCLVTTARGHGRVSCDHRNPSFLSL